MVEGGIRVEARLGLEDLTARARDAARAASLATGEALLRRAAALAPRETGALAASGYVRLEGERVVTGFAAPYAAAQHEGTAFRHPGGGQARFLADAALDPEVTAAMAAAFREGLGGLVH